MIESREGVSDLLFTTEKPPLVEIHGNLEDFPIDTPDSLLASEHIEQIAAHVINGNERLLRDFQLGHNSVLRPQREGYFRWVRAGGDY